MRGCYNLGVMYTNGNGVEKNEQKAVELYKELENGGGGVVAEAAPGRDVVKGKVPAAKGDPAGFQHVQAAGFGVLRVVLIVAVHGDNTQTLGTVVQKEAEGVLQRRALAAHRSDEGSSGTDTARTWL